MALQEILAEVDRYEIKRVCVTGGEPLAQPQVHSLLGALVEAEYRVSLETSGALDVSKVHPRCVR